MKSSTSELGLKYVPISPFPYISLMLNVLALILFPSGFVTYERSGHHYNPKMQFMVQADANALTSMS